MKRYSTLLIVIFFTSANIAFATPIDSLQNMVYGKNKNAEGKTQNLTMDIYFPQREAGKKYPLVLMMHGGGFSTGSKEAMRGSCRILADSGFIAVTINYRKGWDRGSNPMACEGNVKELQAAVYRATQDAHAAMRFLVSNKDEYAIDTAWMFAGGSSAGAVLALNLAYLKVPDAERLLPGFAAELGALMSTTNDSKSSFKIKGVCSMWGAIGDSTLITKATAVPTISYHGTADMVVPYDVGRFGSICNEYPLMYGSAVVYRRTISGGKPAILNISNGGNHGPKEFYSKITMSNTVCFFRKVMEGTATSAVYEKAKGGCRTETSN